MASRPASRDEFEVAVVCALPREYDAASLAFDEFWDDEGDIYGKAPNDPNIYTTGSIQRLNVVLVLLPGMGKVNAANTVASLRSSYSGIRLVILTGICGAAPSQENEIILGDVIISKSVVQYDFGRQYTSGFVRKDTVEDNLGRPVASIRSLLSMFQTARGRDRLLDKAEDILSQMQERAARNKRNQIRYDRPPTFEDKLFATDYVHKHRDTHCKSCTEHACDVARLASCDELCCDDGSLITRKRLSEIRGGMPDVKIFVGGIASGDMIMRSGQDRDRIAKEAHVIGFEMEGAGVWDGIPSIVVKGVCDYADSHKTDKWQDYAAATAASVTKAILIQYLQPIKGDTDDSPGTSLCPSTSTRKGLPMSSDSNSGSWAIFHGNISGKNVVAGQQIKGGTTTMNFRG
ncbi:phosphorylase superfamily protein [Colletotrichum chrysophilum]|uniref:Phosphorylase superfamily protein n=1 Tax=Colletotrichum chrysophilum TaxID=1836956 RepID=A0AAD9E831_9PEZI|nr:phosphorylase superfamily protein [Colletotrichum chrysophilum]